MKKILITGANSYIGVSFENYIRMNYPDQYCVDTVDMIDGTWREKDFSQYDTVFHVAGIAHQKETKRNASMYYEVNRDLAIETAKKSRKDGVEQFVFLSSMSIYGMETGVITKDTVPNPKSNYGKSKLQAEKGINELADKNFKVCILRPPMVYGEGCKGNYNFLRKWIRLFHVFPDYNNQRSMISIENLLLFVLKVIVEHQDGVWFPRNPDYMCTTDLVKLIAEREQIKVYYTKIFNPIIRCVKFDLVCKVFGNYVYKDMNT